MSAVRNARSTTARKAPYARKTSQDITTPQLAIKTKTLILESHTFWAASVCITLPKDSVCEAVKLSTNDLEGRAMFSTELEAANVAAQLAFDYIEDWTRSRMQKSGQGILQGLKDILQVLFAVVRQGGRWVVSLDLLHRVGTLLRDLMDHLRSMSAWEVCVLIAQIINTLKSRKDFESWARAFAEKSYNRAQVKLLGPLLASHVQAIESALRQHGVFDARAMIGEAAAHGAGQAYDFARSQLGV